jgi:hypothetical protein
MSPTSTALTVALSHPDGARTFLSHLGHLEHYPVTALQRSLAEAQAGDLLLLCGYFLLPPLRQAATSILHTARAQGVVTLLDTHAWVWLVAEPKRLPTRARRHIDSEVRGGLLRVSSMSMGEVAREQSQRAGIGAAPNVPLSRSGGPHDRGHRAGARCHGGDRGPAHPYSRSHTVW